MQNDYIDGELLIPDEPTRNATTIGEYENDENQTITFQYDDGLFEQTLYNAKPSCKHKIQAQASGIKCIKCHGWYCA